MKERVEEFYDNYSKNYNNQYMNRVVDEIFEYFLNKYLPKNNKLKILDAGGGVGRFSVPLAKKGNKIILTDISQGMIEKAKIITKEHNIKLFKESVTNMLNQKNESYDVVLLMNGVLDYCKDYKKALQETWRVLKNNGRVIGTVNNKFIYLTTRILLENNNPKDFREKFEEGNYGNDFPIHDFTIQEIKENLKTIGFKVINVLGPTNLLRKWEYPNISNRKELIKTQISFAEKEEYINNSSDFLFIAEKNYKLL